MNVNKRGNTMNDIQYKEILNNMDNLFNKLDSMEERLSKLEKQPHARHCNSCGKSSFEKFVSYQFPDSDKEFEMCPSCADDEYSVEVRKDKAEELFINSQIALNDKAKESDKALGIKELIDN